jgi:hypothetical protein
VVDYIDKHNLTDRSSRHYFPKALLDSYIAAAMKHDASFTIRYFGTAAAHKYEQGRANTAEEEERRKGFEEISGYRPSEKLRMQNERGSIDGKEKEAKTKTVPVIPIEASTVPSVKADMSGSVAVTPGHSKQDNPKNIAQLLEAGYKIGHIVLDQDSVLNPDVQRRRSSPVGQSASGELSSSSSTSNVNKIPADHHKMAAAVDMMLIDPAQPDAPQFMQYTIPDGASHRQAYLWKNKEGEYFEATEVVPNINLLNPEIFKVKYHTQPLQLPEEVKRDLKPVEMLLTPDGKSVIADADFGSIAFRGRAELTEAGQNHDRHGIVTERELAVINELLATAMAKHGGENRNPYTVGLAVSEADPVIAICPPAKEGDLWEVKLLFTRDEVITHYNAEEAKGYNTYFPPEWGFVRDDAGKLIDNPKKFNYHDVDHAVDELSTDQVEIEVKNSNGKTEIIKVSEKELAEQIFSLHYKEAEMLLNGGYSKEVGEDIIAPARAVRAMLEDRYMAVQEKMLETGAKTSVQNSPIYMEEKRLKDDGTSVASHASTLAIPQTQNKYTPAAKAAAPVSSPYAVPPGMAGGSVTPSPITGSQGGSTSVNSAQHSASR